MSTLAVDHNGNQIKTDILTGGYLRQVIEDKFHIKIPSEIKHLCFVFWLINICDEWDHTLYTTEKMKIDGQIVTSTAKGFSSIVGRHRVSSGQFEWKLRHFGVIGVCIGVIEDLPAKEISYSLNKLNYDHDGYGAFWEVENADFYSQSGSPRFMEKYSDKIKDKHVIIGMKIDFDSLGLYYSVDDSEYIQAPYTLKEGQSYRLVVSFWKQVTGVKVELL